MSIQDIVQRMTKANDEAEAELSRLRRERPSERSALIEIIRNYVARKMMLSEDEISDNITKMVRFNVARSLKIEVAELEKMDQRGRCGSAPAVMEKRFLIFIAVQDALGVKIPPAKTPDIQTVQDLADALLPLLEGPEAFVTAFLKENNQ